MNDPFTFPLPLVPRRANPQRTIDIGPERTGARPNHAVLRFVEEVRERERERGRKRGS
jgi:hypothetical protein